MKGIATRHRQFVKAAPGAVLAALCGLALWGMPLWQWWANTSYDYQFRFGSRTVTNDTVLVMMDNEAYNDLHQVRPPGHTWDRSLHAQLLNKLADDGCAMTVFDIFFKEPGVDPTKDQALAEALRRQRHVVLMGKQNEITGQNSTVALTGDQPEKPTDLFLDAAGTNWGVGWFRPDLDNIVRRHWPFPSPALYPSLAWTAARVAGARLDPNPQERWLRYYGENGAWIRLSYGIALEEPPDYFRNKIVFVGNEPHASAPSIPEDDKFYPPYMRWTGDATGGVDLHLTEFLNLVNGEWLRRPGRGMEAGIFILTGILLGGGLCLMRSWKRGVLAAAIALAAALGGVSLSYFSNYWFPWLIIAGGQVPCALAWAAVAPRIFPEVEGKAADRAPKIPGYKLIHPPFGQGAYGKVWLARNKAKQWRAIKVIYLAKFENDAGPYEREFHGVSLYQTMSGQHPGLLRVDFVSEKGPDYFYYVMELGDAVEAGWEREPSKYLPRDLVNMRTQLHGKRLPARQCVEIGIELTEALDFLHRQGLTHRDIKPQNVIFVNGRPKLADLGLITEIRPPDQERTYVGTPGYMPPSPERPGTPQADIYSMGMVLYVLSTGRAATLFPDIATSLVAKEEPAEFLPLNAIVLKACQPDPAQRYASAAEMWQALKNLHDRLTG